MSDKRFAAKNSKKTKKAQFKKIGMGIFLFFFSAFRLYIDWLIDFCISFFYKNVEVKKLPKPKKEEILMKSASALAQQIREKQVSSEAVVSAFIERIKEVNNLLNAVVHDRFDEAIEEAKGVDHFLSTTEQTAEEIKKNKPFLGIPFTSKESTAAKGMAFTIGLVSRKGVKATEDAEVVALMKDSGAILIAVTNTPELNLWCETRNNVYGQTRNPYNFSRTAGGSSGGEAAIISACGSPLGIGTDIGGSTRMPAYYCGLFGHKPTTGLISTKGMSFRTGDEGDTMVSGGTITRYSEDIIPFLKILLGKKSSLLELDKKVNLKEIKIAYCLEPSDFRLSPVSNEIKAAILKAVDHLSSISRHHTEKVNFSGFKYSLSLWRHEMTKEPSKFAADLANQQGEVSLLTELPKLLLGQCKFTLPAIMRLIDLHVLPPTNPKWAEKEIFRLKNDINLLLDDSAVLLFPSCPTDAPYHYASFLRPYNFGYWAIFNVLKLPVTQVPLGLSKKGLPIGLQIVAAPMNDRVAITVAQELERVFGGWIPPFIE